MVYQKFKGNRIGNLKLNRSINIFFMSFIYPTNTGYTKRMDLLIRWADMRFSNINFIIPKKGNITDEIIKVQLNFCDNLFIIDSDSCHQFSKVYSIKRLIYRLITGRHSKFDSTSFLNKKIVNSFKKVVVENKTDFFLNTRFNFGGLINFIPDDTIRIIDTQDIYTDIYVKYYTQIRRKWQKKILLGYREKGYFVKSEIDILSKYDKIIAITTSDYDKYYTIKSLSTKLLKVESVGIEPKKYAVSTVLNKEFDCLFVASNFNGTKKGISWFFNQVAPNFSCQISLCIVGSICDYVESEKLYNKNVDFKLQGIVNSLDHFYDKTKLVILPMQDATGTSVKGLEALAYGATIIATNTGVRFGGLENDFHCIITDDPKAFALAIKNLLMDDKKRFMLGKNALEFAKDKMSNNSAFKLLDSCI